MYLCAIELINAMKKLILSLFVACLALTANAEDGHQLWLRFQPVNKAKVADARHQYGSEGVGDVLSRRECYLEVGYLAA